MNFLGFLGAVLAIVGGILIPQNKWLSKKCILGMVCLVPTSFLIPANLATFFFLFGAVLSMAYLIIRYNYWKHPNSVG